MVQRYRVLEAMLKVDSFTIAEVANETGVVPAYVRIVLLRHRQVFEQLKADTYRVLPKCRLDLEQKHLSQSLNLDLPQLHSPPFSTSGYVIDRTLGEIEKKEKNNVDKYNHVCWSAHILLRANDEHLRVSGSVGPVGYGDCL